MIFMLGGRTPIIDWSGPAGSGKTSVLRLAASVWGSPCEFRGQVIGGWNATVVGIERRASFLGHLPLILNDSNKAPSWLPGKMIYELAEGAGKQRGDIKGGRLDLASWATIVLSSGESRLLDFAKASDAGTTHRVLSIHGSPWGNAKCSQEVHALRDGLDVHYGHAGRLFVQWITAHKAAHLEEWQARRQRFHQMLRAQVQDQTALSRLAEDLAAILVTAELAHEALNLPWSVQKAHQMMKEVLGTLIDNSECYTAHQKAFVSLWEWCWSNQDAFWGRRKTTTPPSQGWIGRWDDAECWNELYVLPSVADKHLESLGYKPLSIRKEWVDAGFIRRGEGRNLLPTVRIDGTKVRCFALLRKAVEEQCNLESDAS